MGLFRRLPIALTATVIVCLASAESWLAWRYFSSNLPQARQSSAERRVAALERELKDKTQELNHLIFQRDAESRRQQKMLASAVTSDGTHLYNPTNPSSVLSQSLAANRLTAGYAAPTEEAELAAASVTRGTYLGDSIRAPQGSAAASAQSLLRDTLTREEREEISEGVADGEEESTPEAAAIDPKSLVNMANIMTGRKVAELTRLQGKSVIRYRDISLRDDDPIWHLLDAIGKAGVLDEISIVAGQKYITKTKNAVATLARNGVPSSMIRVRDPESADGANYKDLNGILITLRSKP
jgi:hypothetical protein